MNPARRYDDLSPAKFEARIEKSNGSFFVRGVHQQADARNQNGRIYPRSLWENILRDGHAVKTRLLERRMVGLLGHPPDGKIDDKMERISHVTTELNLRPDLLVEGTTELLPTPSGSVGRTLFEARVKIGISSRGWGDAHYRNSPEGRQEEILDDDFSLEGFDFVLDPSVATAYPGVVTEAVEQELSSYADVLKCARERLERFTENNLDDKIREELRLYSRILEEYTSTARPLTFYERGGRMSPNGRLIEEMQDLKTRIDRSLEISRLEIGTGDTKLSVLSSPHLYVTSTGVHMPTEAAPDVSRLESKLEEIGKAKEEHITRLKKENLTATRQLEATRRRLVASEQLLDAATKKIKDLSAQLENAQRLVQAGVRRVRKESRHRVNLSKRLAKSEQLLTEAVSKLTSSKSAEMESYRRGLASRLPNAKAAYDVLAKCESIEDMNRTYRSLRTVSGAKPEAGDRASRAEARRAPTRRQMRTEQRMLDTTVKHEGADKKSEPKLEVTMTKKLVALSTRNRR